MIRFFRTFRQKLLTGKKLTKPASQLGKYSLYAIGEIVLVVMGILIALQINTWNENRKQSIVEQNYLNALKQEFETNIKEVNRVIEQNNLLSENAIKLAAFTGPEISNISEESIGQLYFGVIRSEVQYRPGTGVISEIINSGKLNIFKNLELKNALAAMDGLILRIRFQENEELAPRRSELTILGEHHGSMRRMAFDAFGDSIGLGKGRFLESNLQILKLKEFDNHLTAFIYASAFLDSRYQELKTRLEEIIEIIDDQIK